MTPDGSVPSLTGHRHGRLPDLRAQEMTPAQRLVVDAATAGRRGSVPAPMQAWLRSPELAQRAQHLGEFVRYGTSLGPALSELAILVTARFWTSHYEWYAHRREALRAGIAPAVIEAIARRERPDLPDDGARAVYDYAVALNQRHAVPDAVHAAALAALGEVGVVELVGVLGYYTLVAMTLNAFEVGLPEGEEPDLPD